MCSRGGVRRCLPVVDDVDDVDDGENGYDSGCGVVYDNLYHIHHLVFV